MPGVARKRHSTTLEWDAWLALKSAMPRQMMSMTILLSSPPCLLQQPSKIPSHRTPASKLPSNPKKLAMPVCLSVCLDSEAYTVQMRNLIWIGWAWNVYIQLCDVSYPEASSTTQVFVCNSLSMWAPLLAIIPVSERWMPHPVASLLICSQLPSDAIVAELIIIPLLPTFFLPDFDFPTTSTTTWENDPPKCPHKKFRSSVDMVLLYLPHALLVGPTCRTFWEGTWERRWDRVYELFSIP